MSRGAGPASLPAGASVGVATLTPLRFEDLAGWAEDDHAAALEVFRSSGHAFGDPRWRAVAAGASEIRSDRARVFFEAAFRPALIEDGAPALFTGYYEPELPGSRTRDARFVVPLYARPPEAPREGAWLSRSEIEAGALAERGLELAWLEEAVEAFLLQVQGSGRIRLPDGGVLRLGYAGRNGHPYSSVGKALVARGAVGAEEVTPDFIRAWVRAHPEEGPALLRTNASFVFFRELDGLPPEQGPLGTMGVPVTPGRTLAVDSAHVPLGAPIWVEVAGVEPVRRLMVAQDTGSAIRGAQRADLYFGTGAEAGRRAGTLKAGGRMVVLLPRDVEGETP